MLPTLNFSEYETGNWFENASIPMITDKGGKHIKDFCTRYNVTNKQLMNADNKSEVLNTASIVPCLDITFEGSAKSAVTEFNLVCENAWLKPLLTSLYMIGKTIACTFGGMLSDKFGRRPIFLFTTFWQFMIAFVTSFVSTVELYGIFVFLAGFGAVLNYTAASILVSENVFPASRTIAYASIAVGFALGYMLLAAVVYIFQDWRWYLRFSGLFGLLYVPYYWLVDESKLWLVTSGQSERAEKLNQKIKKINGESSSREEDDNMMGVKEETTEFESNWAMMISVLRRWKLLSRFLIVNLSWCMCMLTYYMIAFNTNSLPGNRFVNLFYAGLVEFVSCAFYYMGAEKLGRRNTYISFMSVTSLFILLTPVFAQWNGTIVVVTTMISKLLTSACFNLIYVYTTELFPTNVRHTTICLCNSFSRLGGIVAPYVIYADENGGNVVSSIVIGGLIMLSACLYLLLPETRHVDLPNTIENAEAMKSCFELRRTQEENQNV